MSESTGSYYTSGQQLPSDATQVYPNGIPGLAETYVPGMPERAPWAALYDQMTGDQGVDPLAGMKTAQDATAEYGFAKTEDSEERRPNYRMGYDISFPDGTNYIAFRVQTKVGYTYFGIRRPMADYSAMMENVRDFFEGSPEDVFQMQMQEGVVFLPRDAVVGITIFSCDYVQRAHDQQLEEFKSRFAEQRNQKAQWTPAGEEPQYIPRQPWF